MILVVDDETELAELLAQELKFYGYATRTATCIKDATALIHANKPKLIISDIRMPDGTGFDLFNVIEVLGEPHIPILFVSGYSGFQENDSRKKYLLGVLEKPFDFEKILEFVRPIIPQP